MTEIDYIGLAAKVKELLNATILPSAARIVNEDKTVWCADGIDFSGISYLHDPDFDYEAWNGVSNTGPRQINIPYVATNITKTTADGRRYLLYIPEDSNHAK